MRSTSAASSGARGTPSPTSSPAGCSSPAARCCRSRTAACRWPARGPSTSGRTGRAWICEDLAQGTRFPEDARLLAAGVRSYVRVPLKVRDRLIGSLAFSRGEPGPFPPHEVDVFEALARPIAAAVANALAFEEIARLNRPAPGREPGPAPGDRRALDVRGDRRLLAGPARDPRPGRQGGGDRHHGADHRRDRHRQGAGGAGHPPAVAAVAPRPGGGQLRGPPRLADRVRALRPREGGVHRRAAAPRSAASSWRRAERSSSTRSASCRPRSRPSCCGCSRRGASSGWAAASRSPPTCG